MIVYSINDYIASDATLLSILDLDEITLQPIIGDENSVAPFIIYRYNQDIKSEDMYYIHHDTIKYNIVDLDVDRGLRARNCIVNLLNRGDNIQDSVISDEYGRLLYVNLLTSSDISPSQPDGYFVFSLLFEVCWIQND